MILGLALMMLLIFNNIGIISITDFTNRATMQNEIKIHMAKLSYGIAFNGSVDMQRDKQIHSNIVSYQLLAKIVKIIVLPLIIRLTMLER